MQAVSRRRAPTIALVQVNNDSVDGARAAHAPARERAGTEIARGGTHRSRSELTATAGLGLGTPAAETRRDHHHGERDDLHDERRGVAVAATSTSKSP